MPKVQSILDKVADTYKAMETYKAEGSIIPDGDFGLNRETSFSILLKKPNLYRITWEHQTIPKSDYAPSGAIWNDGTQPYFYMSARNYYSRVSSDDMNFAGATGISDGVTYNIPTLFFSAFVDGSPFFSGLKDQKIEDTEKAGEEEYYVISGSSDYSIKETLWISKTSHLIWKHSESGGKPMQGPTAEEMEEAMKGLGAEVPEKVKKHIRERIEKLKSNPGAKRLGASSTQIYENVPCPELKKSDFIFATPEGVALKDEYCKGCIREN